MRGLGDFQEMNPTDPRVNGRRIRISATSKSQPYACVVLAVSLQIAYPDDLRNRYALGTCRTHGSEGRYGWATGGAASGG
jgi:hypothetical protein